MTQTPKGDEAHDLSDRVKDGLDQAKDVAARAGHKASSGIDHNPLAVLVGGVAVGALAGALLPRSAREKDLLRPVGARLGVVAGAAIAAAKEAGRSELEARGLTAEGAKEKTRTFFSEVGKAATSAGTAAVKTAKAEVRQDDVSTPGAMPQGAASATRPAAGGAADDAGGFNAAV